MYRKEARHRPAAEICFLKGDYYEQFGTFYATVNREPVDRPAAWLGMPDIFAQPALFKHYGVKDFHELKLAVGDDSTQLKFPTNLQMLLLFMRHLTGIWTEM